MQSEQTSSSPPIVLEETKKVIYRDISVRLLKPMHRYYRRQLKHSMVVCSKTHFAVRILKDVTTSDDGTCRFFPLLMREDRALYHIVLFPTMIVNYRWKSFFHFWIQPRCIYRIRPKPINIQLWLFIFFVFFIM